MLMLYGANGYTGALIARRARARRAAIVLAGRNQAALAALGAELDLPVRCFAVDGAASDIDAALRGTTAVLNCAGPFSATAAPLLSSSVKRGTTACMRSMNNWTAGYAVSWSSATGAPRAGAASGETV